jgi:chemotaxis protein methyltransferase CheR
MGQEAYSIAILLDELAVTRGRPMSFRIFATDWSEHELAAARAGVYDEATLQNVRLKHLCRYFTRHDETYHIVPGLRDYVDFSFHDLLDRRRASPTASIYGDFDVVFCNNLLFYYRPDARQYILTQLYRALSPQGYLVTGEAERAIVEKTDGWRAVLRPAAIYQKMPSLASNGI